MLDKYLNGEIKNDNNHVIWLKVMRPTISSVRLYIADRYGKIISVEDNKVNCTLLSVPNSKAHKKDVNLFKGKGNLRNLH